MERQAETQRPNNGQLISVPHKDTVRLLEVYVKRSLSVNDAALQERRVTRKEKWVTLPKKHRRHSSDPSLHLSGGLNKEDIGPISVVEPFPKQPETRPEASEKTAKKTKKNKKPSFWKSFLGIFSRKGNEEKDDEQEGPSELAQDAQVFQAEEVSDAATTCLPLAPVTLQKTKPVRKKSIKRRFSKRRLSFSKSNKPGKDLNPADITRVETVVSVEPTYSYYEKVSEELERIVHEVQEKEEAKPLSNEEIINRIIVLTKQQGDSIDDKKDSVCNSDDIRDSVITASDEKMKDNPTLNNFFQQMSYSSFQTLADAYLEKEASPIHNPPTVLPTAPELVKLAFTYDFTAKIAGLSRQNIGHITGLGNRYLQERFEYNQACTSFYHPLPGSDD